MKTKKNFTGTSLQHPKWNSNINTVIATTKCYNFLYISLKDRLKNIRLDPSLMMTLFLASGQTLHINRKGTIAKEDLIRHEHVCAHLNAHTYCAYHCTYLCVYTCLPICGEKER